MGLNMAAVFRNIVPRALCRSLLTWCLVGLLHSGTSLYSQCNQLYEWTTWNSFSGTSADGVINFVGQSVGVNMTANYTFGSTPGIYGFGNFSGFNGTIPNTTVPFTTWAAGPGGVTTMCFSQTVTNPVLLLASLGNTVQNVTLEFSLPYVVVYDGGGMNFINANTILGAEGYAIIEFPGNFDCVTIYSSTPENYTNITWGLHPPLFQVDIAGQPENCSEVTLTASGGNTYAWSGGSFPNQATNTFTESGNYNLTVTDATGCTVLTSVSVTVYPESSSYYTDEICEGIPYAFQGQFLEESGTYTAMLQTIHGCDSLITLDLTVYPSSSQTTSETICQGESISFFNQTLSASGIYQHAETTQYGCDSLFTLILEVLPVRSSVVSTQLCAGDSIRFGSKWYAMSGTYSQVLTDARGCDSTAVLELDVLPRRQTVLDRQICFGDTLYMNGQALTTEGEYISVLNDVYGCDSTIITRLEVLPSAGSSIRASVCEGQTYAFFGQNLSAAGTYFSRFSSAAGCDSIVSLSLQVFPVKSTSIWREICAGESINFYGKPLQNAGIYTHTLATSTGCDSIISLTLSVLPNYEKTQKATLCAGESIFFGGVQRSQSGTYLASLKSMDGCDSLIYLQLTVLPEIKSIINRTICFGESVQFDGNALTKEGTYTAVLQTKAGCDSIVLLNLTVLTQRTSLTSVQLCEGETYFFNGRVIDKSGTYTDTIVQGGSCDSLATLTVSFSPPSPATRLKVEICGGETYIFQDEEIGTPGEHVRVLKNIRGCDSTVLLDIIVHPLHDDTFYIQICQGESITIEGKKLERSGLELFWLNSTYGCDSIVHIWLDVAPHILYQSLNWSETPYFWPVTGLEYDKSGSYTVVFQSINGCDSIHQLDLKIIPVKKWWIPNIVTESGPNAGFTIYGNDQLASIRQLQIFDRWGNQVAELSNLQPGNAAEGWNGRMPGGACVAGVYTYMAELAWQDGTSEWISGDVTVMR